jgi:hypothetical protein
MTIIGLEAIFFKELVDSTILFYRESRKQGWKPFLSVENVNVDEVQDDLIH